jgi:hypothetical protein
MNRFRNGQKVICINSAQWYKNEKNFWGRKKKVTGPKKGEVLKPENKR